ncbi:YibE/F family protein, partial [Modestobacter sp. VKM Ac-2676]
MQLLQFDPTLDFSGLVLAALVVAGLGILNDVTITQASAVWQLHDVSPEMSWVQLFQRGMAIGRDHIASTIYTIVFAYAGAALPLLMLFEIYQRPFWTTLTGASVGEEVIRTLVGGIALVLAVPVTTLVGAWWPPRPPRPPGRGRPGRRRSPPPRSARPNAAGSGCGRCARAAE